MSKSAFCYIDSSITLLPKTAGGGGLVFNTSDYRSRGQGFEPHWGCRVMSLSKTYLPPLALNCVNILKHYQMWKDHDLPMLISM